MEYIYYSLCVLALIALVLSIFRLPGHTHLANDQIALANAARRRKEKQRRRGEDSAGKVLLRRRSRILRRELSKVPTPWGWPQHEQLTDHKNERRSNGAEEVHGFSEALTHWADRLIHKKKTIDDDDYLQHKQECVRALLEDRYGKSSTAAKFQYRPVKAPLLRDPRLPHDQMDNFPSGHVDKIEAKLARQKRSDRTYGKGVRVGQSTRLEDLKKPWGW